MLRVCFQDGRYSKSSSLEIPAIYSTACQGWPFCELSTTGGTAVHDLLLSATGIE